MENRKPVSNDKLYMDNLAAIDPKLWRIKNKLINTGINPEIIPSIIDMLYHVYKDNGYGDIIISMEGGIITQVLGRTQKHLNIDVADKIEYNSTTTSFK